MSFIVVTQDLIAHRSDHMERPRRTSGPPSGYPRDSMSRPDNRSLIWSILPGLLVIVGSALALYLVYGPPYPELRRVVLAGLGARHRARLQAGLQRLHRADAASAADVRQLPVAAAGQGDDRLPGVAGDARASAGSSGWSICSASELFNRPVGALAAIVILTRPAFAKNAEAAYQDIPFVLFVCWALLIEIQRRGAVGRCCCCSPSRDCCGPRRGCSPVSIGSGCSRRAPGASAIGLAALVCTAPVLWAISDYAIAGDFLHSFHGTKNLAAQLDRPRSTISAPYWTAKFFGFTLREPLIIGVPIGCVFMIMKAKRQAKILLGVATHHDRRVHSQHGRRTAADRALRADADGAARDRLRGRSFRLAQSRPCRSAAEHVEMDRRVLADAVDRLHPVAHPAGAGDSSTKIHNYQSIQANLRTFAEFAGVPEVLQGRADGFRRRITGRCRRSGTSSAVRPGVVQSTQDTTHPLANLALYPASRLIAQKFYSAIPDLSPPHQTGGPAVRLGLQDVGLAAVRVAANASPR